MLLSTTLKSVKGDKRNFQLLVTFHYLLFTAFNG